MLTRSHSLVKVNTLVGKMHILNDHNLLKQRKKLYFIKCFGQQEAEIFGFCVANNSTETG